MKRLSKRVFSLILALMLCVGIVGARVENISAAEIPTVEITALVADRPNVQVFSVYTSVEAQYIARFKDGTSVEGNLVAGTSPLTFESSDSVNLEVFAAYTKDDGKAGFVTQRLGSLTEYSVVVTCVTEEGEVLQSEVINLSKYNNPQVVYNAPEVIDGGAVEYHATNPSVLFKYGEVGKSITYTTVEKGAKSYTINYVDVNDNVLYTESKTLKYGETASITAPATYTDGTDTYNLKTTGSYNNVTYEQIQSVYTFEYVKQAPAAKQPYDITIKLVNENGTVLHTMKKSVDVNKSVTVAIPATYEVGQKQYKLADGEPTSITREYASTDAKTYTVNYVLSGETKAYDVTINCVDKATGKVLATVTGTVEPDGAPYTYEISSKNSIKANGTTYQVISGQGNGNGKIVHAYGDAAKSYTVYYNAKQVKNPESYTVTMRYICVNDNVVLERETKTVKVNSSVTFDEAPETLTVDGKEYILLNGQDGTTVHKYNDSQKSYAIYYRDAAIEMDPDDIVIPQPGTDEGDQDADAPTTPGTTVTPGTTETDDETTTEEESEVEEESSEATSQPTTEDEESSEAVESEVEIIEEEDVPLAANAQDAEEEDEPSAMPYVIGGISLLVIIVLIVLFVVKKKKASN